ncbi:Sterol-4-alpha-carboxylate 3-dehydrogenase, decarboxylating [Chlamydiales bacterium SCGC AG-110-P3]|nr:Sterol-4-alpha-carboxylate 3-dehydrogenase, decarboxylating [Chlamydiales bacterium SCGC AG-110-P3]
MKVLVTGGAGFLGMAIVKLLISRGYEVNTYSRGTYPELEKIGAKHFTGDLLEVEKLTQAAQGCEGVFHAAAKAGIWGKYQNFYDANVLGTENVINLCLRTGIDRCVYTSSPSVAYGPAGSEGLNEEQAPYPNSFKASYPQTKAIAEKHVLQINGDNLATAAIRPHLIWGPGDHHFLPRLVRKSRAGKLSLIGNKQNLVDCIYIDNAAMAHIQLFENLAIHSPVAGKAYFISQDNPIPISDLINKILEAAGAPPVVKRISPTAAYMAGALLERIYRLLRISKEPRITRFVAEQLSTPHWFDISAAKKDFGYQPTISIDEGMMYLKEWIEHHPIK